MFSMVETWAGSHRSQRLMFAREPGLATRRPAVAGSFYPRESKELKTAVDTLLSQAGRLQQPGLTGVVAPHAGYIYSGPVAAKAFAAVAATGAFRRVLLLGPA